MSPAVFRHPLFCALEHVGRWIDRDNVRVRRICVQRDSGADANLEHAVTGPEIQAFDNFMLAIDKNPAEEKIIETRQVGIDTALMWWGHRKTPLGSTQPRRSVRGRFLSHGDFGRIATRIQHDSRAWRQAAALIPRN